jgi:uncharacterized membrane protein HdeD (DUF308 family)
MLTAVASKWWVLLLRGICAIIAGVFAIAWPGVTLLFLVCLYGAFALSTGLMAIWMGFKGDAGQHWWGMVLMGVVGVLAGLMAFFWPGATLVALLVIIAAAAITEGVFEIIAAIRLRKVIDDEWLLILSGALSIILGLLLLSNMGVGAAVIAIWIGAYMIAVGIMTVALSLRLRGLYKRLHHAGAAA